MISFVPTSRSFRWRNAVTWPCAIGILLYLGSIGALHWFNQATHRDFTPCLFKNVTGVPCFLCGGTRASLSLAKGDIVAATLYNPLVCAVLILAVCLVGIKTIAGLKIEIAPRSRTWLWATAISAVVANWVYVATHL